MHGVVNHITFLEMFDWVSQAFITVVNSSLSTLMLWHQTYKQLLC